MTVIEIVREYLKREGYDGLFNAESECGCLFDNLAPCSFMCDECEAGYKHPCTCGDHDWHIEREKP